MPKEKTLSVTIMGTGTAEPSTIPLEQSFFEELANERMGKFTPEPKPFLAPCKDGLLICYNVIRDGFGISGEAIHFKMDDLEHYPHLKEAWEGANKPMTVKAALLYFGFPEKKS